MTNFIFVLVTAFSFAGAPSFATAQTDTELYEQAEALRTATASAADLQTAEKLHQGLVERGYHRSLVRLADIYERTGRSQQAIETYNQAIAAGSSYARTRLGQGHAEGRFGNLSQPEQGFTMLKALAETSDNSLAKYSFARALEMGNGTSADKQQALALYRDLAQNQQHGLSAMRLGAMALEGDGMAQDLNAAAGYYQNAAANGIDYALVGLARAQQAMGKNAEALSTINSAVEKGVQQAAARRAIWHYQEELGAASDKAFGRSELKRLAEAGDVMAARSALVNHERRSRRITTLDLDTVLAGLNDRMAGGDQLATVALARAYRELRWLIPNARGKHAELVKTYGSQLGPQYETAENLTALYDRNNHRQSRTKAYDYLQTVKGEGFGYGMSRLRSIERTSYVYVMQKELAELGYYSGSASGKMTRRTTKAMLKFCADEGLYDTCIHGPLNYDSALEMSLALAERRNIE